jgi:hypothetical protein
MKKSSVVLVLCSVLFLSSCNGWFFQPNGYNPPTPFRPPTQTPSIVTATPASAATATPVLATPTMPVDTPAVVITDTLFAPPADTITPEPTSINPVPSLYVEILGCNTSIDILHGLGEVTNAYVLLKNTGSMELTNLKVTLYALDEGQAHPDKTVEIASLPAAYQVTVKLTVDSTYRADTPIQVEVLGDGGLFQRLGADACKDLGLTSPSPESLNTPVPY